MRSSIVIDTNVAVVANGKSPQAGDSCVLRCIDALDQCRADQRVLVDDGGLVLDEYRRYLSPSGRPGVGDAFFKWLWDNQGNDLLCGRIPITPNVDRGFEEFPDDPELARFDPADRKFVAVALASGEHPPILNATDRKSWWRYRVALTKHGVHVRFLCPELMDLGGLSR